MKATYTFVNGAKGTGKSLYARWVALQRIAAGGRVVIVDPAGSAAFSGIARRVSVAAARAGLASIGEKPFSIAVQPEWREDITDLFEAVYRAGRLLLVVDEAHDYGTQQTLDRNFLAVVEKGRNQRIDIITTQQAPVGLVPKIRSQWDVVISFRQQNPAYADQMAREYFRDERAAGWLLALPNLHYLRVDGGGSLTRGTVRVPG